MPNPYFFYFPCGIALYLRETLAVSKSTINFKIILFLPLGFFMLSNVTEYFKTSILLKVGIFDTPRTEVTGIPDSARQLTK